MLNRHDHRSFGIIFVIDLKKKQMEYLVLLFLAENKHVYNLSTKKNA